MPWRRPVLYSAQSTPSLHLAVTRCRCPLFGHFIHMAASLSNTPTNLASFCHDAAAQTNAPHSLKPPRDETGICTCRHADRPHIRRLPSEHMLASSVSITSRGAGRNSSSTAAAVALAGEGQPTRMEPAFHLPLGSYPSSVT